MKLQPAAIATHNRQNRVLVDYFKCPEDFADIEAPNKPSMEQGFFRFGSGTICYGRCQAQRLAACPIEPLFDASGAAEIGGGTIRLPFDLTEIVDNLRRERYAVGESSSSMGLLAGLEHRIYYSLRPWMPATVRQHLQRAYLRGWNRLQFPQWPVDCTVENLLEQLLILCMRAKRITRLPFIWFWPAAAQSCAMMTHDVETSTGLAFCRELMQINDSFDIKSSFQFVPEVRYKVSDELLDEVRRRGFEVNVQDLNHDGNLFRNRKEFLRRAKRINEYLRQYRAKGFRSAIMYRNAEWLDALEASYDMSFPNVAHLEPQRGGCCTVMPYFIGGIVELPLTAIQDYSLLRILGESSIRIWNEQIELVRRKNGLVSFVVHPDYLKGNRELTLYKSLLGHLHRLRAEENLWIALPAEINDWWRARNQMELVTENDKWQIRGEQSGQARIAYAILENDRLTYAFEQDR